MHTTGTGSWQTTNIKTSLTCRWQSDRFFFYQSRRFWPTTAVRLSIRLILLRKATLVDGIVSLIEVKKHMSRQTFVHLMLQRITELASVAPLSTPFVHYLS